MIFMHRIKHKNDKWDKGIEIKETFEDAKQSYHAYLGAYAYDHEDGTDFVQCLITDELGTVLMGETWAKPAPAPEPDPEEE